MAKQVRLVVGLGNPGPEYDHTWHNLGFRTVRKLAGIIKTSLKNQTDSLVGKGRYAGHDITLVLPQEFMNLSGKATSRIAKSLNIHDENILVVLDDHDLPAGQLRMRESGGDGGHRGLRSILDELGTDHVARLRVGIRDETVDTEAGGYDNLAGKVLDKLSPREEMHMEKITEAASKAVLEWLRNGIITAMNRYNNMRVLPPEDPDTGKNNIVKDGPEGPQQ